MHDMPQKIAGKGLLIVGSVAIIGLLLTACATPQKKEPSWSWPLPPEKPRLRYIESIRSSKDVKPVSTLDKFKRMAGGASRGINITKPYGVAVHNNVIYVTDTVLGVLLVFDKKNRVFKLFGLKGAGRLDKPIGVTVDNKGLIYVTDAHQHRVVVYGQDGSYIRAFGGSKRLVRPTGVAINPVNGRIYVVDAGTIDSKHHAVSVFDRKGKHLFDFGKRGSKKGSFNFPTNLTIGADGKVYVVDTGNFRVQIFDADGKYLDSFGTAGTRLGSFARPKGIALDSENNIYVVDSAFNNIQIFDQKKRLLLFAGTMGRNPGQFWLPAGIYIDANDRIYVADQYNHRIQIWQYLKQTGAADNKVAPKSTKSVEK